ncbi:MAG: GNAT family N-acetyltransferase/hotdog fold thioesterase, partial [Colwellia sp.]|nr:GNAT family N-acetyltransferase/hotdog fold thioesterase [Colwellia sp.]
MNTPQPPKNAEEFLQYYQLRWQILRKPCQQADGSEQDELEQQSIHRVILDKHGKAQAVGRLEQYGDQQGEIRYIAVCQSVQGQGLGRKVVTELESQARKLGMITIVLNAGKNSLGFYQALGYQEHSVQPDKSSEPLFNEVIYYRMTKTLSPHPQHKKIPAQKLQNIWHETIPMSKAMGLQISYYDGKQLITHCDAKFNKNLHNTMFAGSIYTLATLTGWGWVYLALKEYEDGLSGDIVLAEANIRYHSPIKGLAYGQVVATDMSGSFDNLACGKNARIKLAVHIYCGDKIAATFTGSYFVLPKKNQEKLSSKLKHSPSTLIKAPS